MNIGLVAFALVNTIVAVIGAVHPRLDGMTGHRRVFGGFKPLQSFPWMAGIRFAISGDNFCGGSLIAPQYVLTAAHCVTFRHAPPSVLYVSVGSNLINGTDGDAEVFTVADYWKMPFAKVQIGNDIAVLKLDRPSTKPTIPLGERWVGANTSAIILGWGQTTNEGDSSSRTLLQANLTVINSSMCQHRIRNSSDTFYLNWNISDSQLCAGGVNGTGSCYGDSGGPLLARKTKNGTLALIGDVSFGVACGAGIPDVFGRISTAKEFIDNHTIGHRWI